MIYYTYRRRIIRSFLFYKVLFRASMVKAGRKTVYVDIRGIVINRYLYNFLKFFHLNNYTVFLPCDKKIISKLLQNKGEFEYSSWLLKEGFVKFGCPSKINFSITIDKDQLSNDYFSFFFKNRKEKNTYHVPMSEYPALYHKGYWKEEVLQYGKRKRVIFMIGNINKKFYNQISEGDFFNVFSRRAVTDYILNKDYYFKITSPYELYQFIKSNNEKKVVLIDTSKDFRVEGIELKQVLKKFDFYLALPGILIPQSHNLIEAMSVGNIPIIQKEYADLFRPRLCNGENALIYDSLEELDKIIVSALLYSEQKIFILRRNVLRYYTENLCPEAVVQKIENNNYSKIYIQAEEISLSWSQLSKY